jgi:hypothetical protein
VEALTVLLAMKVANPDLVFLLPGNHGFREVNGNGHPECFRELSDPLLWISSIQLSS